MVSYRQNNHISDAEQNLGLLLISTYPDLSEYFRNKIQEGTLRDLKFILLNIDKYIFNKPVLLDSNRIRFFDENSYLKRDEEYKKYKNSEINFFFRNSKTDPQYFDPMTFPPITVDENYVIIEGKHRAYASKKFKKLIRVVKVEPKNNINNNTLIIKNLALSIW
jgi:hypothetical protein